jgi:1-acyl-sn-glycerol-3-phosphate acyltransferase
MRSLARLLVRVFFRRIEVEGMEALSAPVPTVLVANHINGLVDALLLMATLPRFPRFLGKSTLFRILPLWPFLKLAGVVPVYRAKDGEATQRNESSFRTCRAMLAQGAEVALFPEGISHDQSMLQPLKTGAARIALGAAVDDGVDGVVTAAVGLAYDAKARFRSRALVRAGTIEGMDRWVGPYRHDPHQAVRDLTADLADRLMAVSPTYRSWVEADEWRRIAEVVLRPMGSGTTEVDLGAIEATARLLAEAEEAAERGVPDGGAGPGSNGPESNGPESNGPESNGRGNDLAALRRAFADYERDLALVGLSDGQLTRDDGRWRRRLLLGWSVVRVVAALPAAAIGFVVHVVPYQIMKKVGRWPDNESIQATVKLLGCTVLFAVVYAGLGVGAAEAWGPGAGVGAAVAGPVCGYATVRLVERVKRIGGLVVGAGIVRRRRAVLVTVLEHRRGVVEAATVVLALG